MPRLQHWQAAVLLSGLYPVLLNLRVGCLWLKLLLSACLGQWPILTPSPPMPK
jgi:hypothetical protein